MQVFTPGHIASNDWMTIQTPYSNIGKTQNIGVDLQINARPVVTKNFFWNSALPTTTRSSSTAMSTGTPPSRP